MPDRLTDLAVHRVGSSLQQPCPTSDKGARKHKPKQPSVRGSPRHSRAGLNLSGEALRLGWAGLGWAGMGLNERFEGRGVLNLTKKRLGPSNVKCSPKRPVPSEGLCGSRLRDTVRQP